MKKVFFIISLFLLSSVFAVAEPMNMGLLELQIEHYYNDGHYEQGIQKQITEAQTYLAQRITENQKLAHPKKLALVLDIDETSLSNYADMKRMNFGGTMKQINAATAADNDPAIKPTLELFNFAKAHAVTIFFITGRPESQRQETIANLTKVGFSGWHALLMKPDEYNQPSIIPFKSHERAKIEKQGYDIAVNVGDQYSDLNGGYSDKIFKLPDPFYYIP